MVIGKVIGLTYQRKIREILPGHWPGSVYYGTAMQENEIKRNRLISKLSITPPVFYWELRNIGDLFFTNLFWNDIPIYSKISDDSALCTKSILADGIIYTRGDPCCFRVCKTGIIRLFEIYRERVVCDDICSQAIRANDSC